MSFLIHKFLLLFPSGLSIVNLDFAPSLTCILPKFDLIVNLYYATIIPLCLAALLLMVLGAIRFKHSQEHENNMRKSETGQALDDLFPCELVTHFKKKELYVLQKTFYSFDKDGSGTIDCEELGNVFSEFGHEFTEHQIMELLSDALELQVDSHILDPNTHEAPTHKP